MTQLANCDDQGEYAGGGTSEILSAGNMEYIRSRDSSSSDRVLSLMRCRKQCITKLKAVASTDDPPAATTRQKLMSNLTLAGSFGSSSPTSSNIRVTQ